MKDSYLIAGMRLRPLIRLLARNQVSLSPRNTLRILFLLQSACWSSFFSRVERTRYGTRLAAAPVPCDPVFIVGHWRTGSTLLHQLMAQDPLMTVPTLFQVALPENFLVSYKFYRPVFSLFTGSTRPMDNVRIGMDEPQEDEYALFRLTTRSPLEQMIFPATREYFLESAPFLPPPEESDWWESQLTGFFRKLSFVSGKRIVSKNPFNSFRIRHLARIFPEARFIHIVRHPLAVVPSTRHLWQVVQKQNILNRNYRVPDVEEISLFMSQMVDTIEAEWEQLQPNRKTVVRYEDLEQDPVRIIRSLYAELELQFGDSFRERLNRYLESLSGYRKNVFTLTADEKTRITEILVSYMERYHYKFTPID